MGQRPDAGDVADRPQALAGTQALLGSAAVDLGTPGVLRATLAAAPYPTLLGVFCMGVGMLLRDQVAALGVLIPFFFLVTRSWS